MVWFMCASSDTVASVCGVVARERLRERERERERVREWSRFRQIAKGRSDRAEFGGALEGCTVHGNITQTLEEHCG